MSSKIVIKSVQSPVIGMYAMIWKEDGQVWDMTNSCWVDYDNTDPSDYENSASTLDSSGGTASLFSLPWPSVLQNGLYTITWHDGTASSHPGDVTAFAHQTMKARWDGDKLEVVNGSTPSDIYHANIGIIRHNNNSDRYTVSWFKNSNFVPSLEITSPSVEVYDSFTDTIILSIGMNQVSTTGIYTHVEFTFLSTQGNQLIITAEAIIDGSLRTFTRILGLGDSQISGGTYI